jgi:anti-sigma regulatory factor (Ser/Thr protein kinase)
MAQQIIYSQSFQIRGGDFINAGTVSVQIKKILKELGLKPEVIYKVAICCYEAEMNVIMYSYRGNVDFSITPDEVIVTISDEGPGIKNIELAMKEGFSTATPQMREMGFGAGMGLPNIKKNSDVFEITSEVLKGTKLVFKIYLN